MTNSEGRQKECFLFKLQDVLLFARPERPSEISKLSRGQSRIVHYRPLFTDIPLDPNPVLKNLLEHREITRLYGLPFLYAISRPAAELVISNDIFTDFRERLETAVRERPGITLGEFVRSWWPTVNPPATARQLPAVRSRAAGRPKATRDPKTGELMNVSNDLRRLINLWDSGIGFEAIRAERYPRTRMATTKSNEICLIKRTLRRRHDLLKRPYSNK